jgi:hypothetical protein
MVPNLLFDMQTVGSIANLMLANLLNYGSLLGDLSLAVKGRGRCLPPAQKWSWPGRGPEQIR